jgi:hypothetical protein
MTKHSEQQKKHGLNGYPYFYRVKRRTATVMARAGFGGKNYQKPNPQLGLLP